MGLLKPDGLKPGLVTPAPVGKVLHMKSIDMSKEEYIGQSITTLAGGPEDKRTWIYRIGEDGPRVREVDIYWTSDKINVVTVVQTSDFHFNLLNGRDLKENNPTLMSTRENRKWLANGTSEFVAKNSLKYGEYFADQIVVTGDALDYLSHGAVEMLERIVWEKYPDALVAAGNHEWVQRMQGDVPETLTLEERAKWLESVWAPHHDLYYASRIIKDKVMVIQLDDGLCRFWDSQVERLKSDILIARENNYAVLVFFHVPLWTNNPKMGSVKQIIPVYKDRQVYDFNKGLLNNREKIELVGLDAPASSATKKVYDLITHNADVVKGIFAGHEHTDFYTEVTGYHGLTSEKIMIPQYIMSTAAVDPFGSVTKITIY